jgi:hypothetical protein
VFGLYRVGILSLIFGVLGFEILRFSFWVYFWGLILELLRVFKGLDLMFSF